MKKKVFFIIFLIILIIGLVFILFKMKDDNKNKNNKINDDKKVEEKKKEDIPVYKDENNINISIYTQTSGLLTKVIETKEKYVSKKDIKVYQIYPSLEGKVSYSGRFGALCGNKWLELDSEHKVKQGFIISYTLKDGTKINQKILDPSTTQTNYDYIEIYLYDDYIHRNDSWYSHIEEKDYNDKTYFTSIKITAGSKVSEIATPIILKAFTYDTEDDFDKDGLYRGNSFAEVSICDLSTTCNV